MSDEPLLPPVEAEAEGESEEAGPQAVFLLNHSDDRGNARDDLWRQGLQDLRRMPLASGFEWRPIGPAPLQLGPVVAVNNQINNGPGPFGGEVTDIAIDPSGATDQVIYVATNDGGIWKTSDGGVNWQPLTDDLPSLSMGAVALDPVDPQIVYAGSGNPFDGGVEFSRGAGLYKSMNGGSNWTVVDGGPFSSVLAGLHINRILVLPGDVLLVATRGGLFRSEDGGLNFGANAPQCNDGRPLDDIGVAEITSLVRDTVTATTIYAAVSGKGIFVSTDNGRTFPAASNLFGVGHNGAPAVYNDIAFAMSVQTIPPLNKRVFYASVQYDPPSGAPQYVGLFISRDEGATWTPSPSAKNRADTNDSNPVTFTGASQTNYDLTIGVDPQDPNRVYIGFQQLWMSGDTGRTFNAPPITRDAAHKDQVHWDHHALAFQPASHWPTTPAPATPTRLYVGTDGGLSRMEVSPANVISWNQLNGGIGGAMAAGLMFAIDIGRGNAAANRFTYGGAQDLGLEVNPASDTNLNWSLVMSGDGLCIAVDPSDPQIAYGFSTTFFVRANHGTWDFARAGGTVGLGLPTPPDHIRCIAVEQNGTNPAHRVVYAGVSNQLWQSADGGLHFNQVAGYNFASPMLTLTTTHLDSNRLWVGLADGSVHCSQDTGATWDAGDFKTSTGGNGPVTGIAVDPGNINRVAVTHAKFSNINPNFRTRHVFLTEDNGVNWRDISGTDGQPETNLPDLPLHDVIFDGSTNPPSLILGSDAAVLVSRDLGATWRVLGVGLPNVLCKALALDGSAAPPLVRLGTYGRGCFELKKITGPRLEVQAKLAFDARRVGGQSSLIVPVLNAGDVDLQITGFSRVSGSADFAVDAPPAFPLTLHPGERQVLTVRYQPAAAGRAEAGFQIISNDPVNPSFFFLANGRGFTGAGTPRLALQTNLGFGQVSKSSGARSLVSRLENSGTADLQITEISRASGSADFVLSPALALPVTLHPSDHLDVSFRFDPSSDGDHHATFEIVSNDPRSPATLEMHGSAMGFSNVWLIVLLVGLGVAAGVGGYLIYDEVTK